MNILYKMALLIYIKMQSQKKKWQNASTEDRKCSFFTKQKNEDRSELILIEIQSFQTEKVLNGGPYH